MALPFVLCPATFHHDLVGGKRARTTLNFAVPVDWGYNEVVGFGVALQGWYEIYPDPFHSWRSMVGPNVTSFQQVLRLIPGSSNPLLNLAIAILHTVAGTGTADAVPDPLALKVNLWTDSGLPHGNGRVFLPGLSQTFFNDTTTYPTDIARAQVVTFMSGLAVYLGDLYPDPLNRPYPVVHNVRRDVGGFARVGFVTATSVNAAPSSVLRLRQKGVHAYDRDLAPF